MDSTKPYPEAQPPSYCDINDYPTEPTVNRQPTNLQSSIPLSIIRTQIGINVPNQPSVVHISPPRTIGVARRYANNTIEICAYDRPYPDSGDTTCLSCCVMWCFCFVLGVVAFIFASELCFSSLSFI